MQPLDFPRRRNRPTLHLLSKINAELSGEAIKIRVSEVNYLKNRDPATLRPLGLSEELTKFLLAKYRGAAKKYRLAWIESLRKSHGLYSCPMCGSTGATSLDHYLPKEEYPEFSIFSYNLLPCCVACNQKRGNSGAFTRFGDSFLHPYFDHDLLRRTLLCVTFRHPYEAVIFMWRIYGARPNEKQRVVHHLERSISEPLFRDSMQAFWNTWRRKSFRMASEERVREALSLEISDRELNGRNSWELAFMRGLEANSQAIVWMINNDPAH